MIKGTFCDWLINQGVRFHPETVIVEASSVNDWLMGLADGKDLRHSEVDRRFKAINTPTLPIWERFFIETKYSAESSIVMGQFVERLINLDKHPHGFTYSITTFMGDMDQFGGYSTIANIQKWNDAGIWEGVLGLEPIKLSDYWHDLLDNLEPISDIDPYWYILIFSMDFIHQRAEIELVDYSPSQIRVIKKREGKEPSPYFRIIAPGEPQKRYKRYGQGATSIKNMPLHIVRGHFRHTENHPIAHFNGTFWIAAHTRGDEQLGKLVKHYKIRLPESETA